MDSDFQTQDSVKQQPRTIEELLESELSEHLGYGPMKPKGETRATAEMVAMQRNMVKKQVANTNELEDKIIGMYAKGMSVRDIQETLRELYGGDVSPATLSTITDLQSRGVQDIFIACMDGLSGFKEAVLVFH